MSDEYFEPSTLAEFLKTPQDFDYTMYYLGCSIGIFKERSWNHFREVKGVFWTSNEIQTMLFSILNSLVEQKIIVYDNDDLMYWWSNDSVLE